MSECTQQSTRRQAKKLEIAGIRPEILMALGRELDRFLQEQRQQAAHLIEPDLIDQAAALNAASNPSPPRE